MYSRHGNESGGSDQSLTELLPALFDFWRPCSREAGRDDLYDGGVLEYALDGDAGAGRITAGTAGFAVTQSSVRRDGAARG